MGTLASNRKGYIVGATASEYSASHAVTSGTAYDAASSNVNTATQYFFSTGRGGGTHRFTRTFIHFDTSGITGGSSFQLTLTSSAGSNATTYDVIGVLHDAGSGNGGELDNADFNNIDRNTAYTSSVHWASSGTITMSLNAAAAQQIIDEDDFNIALILNHDFAEEEEGPLAESGNISNGIAFGSAISLTYTDPASGYGHDVSNVGSESIGKVNTVEAANIGKINTVG